MTDIWGDQRGIVEPRIMVAQAGNIAMREARKAPRWWWVDERRLVAIHEAAHAVVRMVLLGEPPPSVSLEEFDTPEGPMIQGLTTFRVDDDPTPGKPVGTPKDEWLIESLSRSLNPKNGWEAYAAELEKRTEQLVSDDWTAIQALGLELSGRDIIYQAEIESIVASARLRAAETHLG